VNRYTTPPVGLSRNRLVKATALIAICSVAALGLVDCGSPSSGSAAGSHPPGAEQLSTRLAAIDLALRRAIDDWRADRDPPTDSPPVQLVDTARDLQATVRSLAKRPGVAANTIARLPGRLASEIRKLTRAARDLNRLSGGGRPPKLRTGPPRPLAELMRYYRAAHRRFRVAQHYLAAIHLVESKFGRVKSDSVAGAKGPMQFIPSTWQIYGHGGDIHDPHDAILAAGRFLRDAGAPRHYSRALYAYNPSQLYVRAVRLYAALIERDPYAVYFLYCWGP
jgi:membrane-bound lytic murein transglycosylase B